MWQIKPRNHEIYRKHNHRVNRYPFSKMIVNDYFEDKEGFLEAIRNAALSANKRLHPREFWVKLVDGKVRCTRVK
jgi:hypothetical protein